MTVTVGGVEQGDGMAQPQMPHGDHERRLQVNAPPRADLGELVSLLAQPLQRADQRQQQVCLAVGARGQHRLDALRLGSLLQLAARLLQPPGAQQHAIEQLGIGRAGVAQLVGLFAKRLGFGNLPRVELVLSQ